MFEFTDEERKEREERLEKRKQEYLYRNFGTRFKEASLSNIHESIAVQGQKLVYEWLKKRKNMLVLIGPPGTGKTYICAAIASSALRLFNSPRYWKEEFLFDHLHNAIERYRDYIESLRLAFDDDFCILDDIGSGKINEWRKEVIFNAVDIRFNSTLPFVVTSNLDRQEISREYGERTADRLFSKENTIISLFGMPSLRQEEIRIDDSEKTNTD